MYSLSDYDYDLPEENIAQVPEKKRDQSKLLFLDRKTGAMSHHRFYDLQDFLIPGDVLVINNTEVIPGRLPGRKDTGGKVEVLILDYADGVKKKVKSGEFFCSCLIKASKGPKKGSRLHFDYGLTAEILDVDEGVYSVKFTCDGDFETLLSRVGKVPLPPYIKRNLNSAGHEDKETYQTIYASEKGAIAAPTAGLHFTPGLMDGLKEKGITIATITLHVSYGTFIPVRVDDIRDHQIHTEYYVISRGTADIVNQARSKGGRVVAVGTTSVRTLEYASDDEGFLSPGSGNCDLFIYPGYAFKIVDAVITNFHLPKSTLLMLVSAFAGRDRILNAYGEAINKGYRFYSYGDAMVMS